MYYVGRKDFQIKHLGHRIELGEIETVMGAIPQVERVCVQYLTPEQKILAFYVGDIDRKEIYHELRSLLPQYKIPNVIVPVVQMPLTKNGKIDRAQLRRLWQDEHPKND